MPIVCLNHLRFINLPVHRHPFVPLTAGSAALGLHVAMMCGPRGQRISGPGRFVGSKLARKGPCKDTQYGGMGLEDAVTTCPQRDKLVSQSLLTVCLCCCRADKYTHDVAMITTARAFIFSKWALKLLPLGTRLESIDTFHLTYPNIRANTAMGHGND